MAIKVKKTTGASKIDPKPYIAVIRSVVAETPKTPSAFNPDCDPFLKWTLRVYKPTREGVEVVEPYEITYLTTMKLTSHPKNKLNNFLKAVGVDVEDGDELDVESAVGKRVQLSIHDKETDQGTFSQVTDVYPAPVQAAKKPAPAPVAAKPVVKKAAPVQAPAPVEEVVEEDVPPPVAETADDDLGDLDAWASMD